jgi:hypothetical protein
MGLSEGTFHPLPVVMIDEMNGFFLPIPCAACSWSFFRGAGYLPLLAKWNPPFHLS